MFETVTKKIKQRVNYETSVNRFRNRRNFSLTCFLMDSSQQLELLCSKGIFFKLLLFCLFLVIYVSPSFNASLLLESRGGRKRGRKGTCERDKTIYRCRDRVNWVGTRWRTRCVDVSGQRWKITYELLALETMTFFYGIRRAFRFSSLRGITRLQLDTDWNLWNRIGKMYREKKREIPIRHLCLFK